jgi:hypothetical protein
MNSLIRRVFCAECGAIRIRQPRSPYAICPNGHGRLVQRFTVAEYRQAIAAGLPRARRIGRSTFAIDGHNGPFCYRDGSGRRRVEPDAKVQANEIVARHVVRTRVLIRVFTRKSPRRTKGQPSRQGCADESC